MESNSNARESVLAKEDTASKQDYIALHTFQPYHDQTQPKVIVQPNISHHITYNHINAQTIPQGQSHFGGSREHNLSAECLYAGGRNQATQSNSGEIILQDHILSQSESFQLDDKNLKSTPKSPLFESVKEASHEGFEKNGSHLINVQDSSHFSKSNLSDSDGSCNEFEDSLALANYNSCIINTLQSLTHGPQQISVANVAEISNKNFLTDKSEVGKNIYIVSEQEAQSNTGNVECDTINPNEPVTAVVDILEETVVTTTENEHFCVEEAGTPVLAYSCGLCHSEFYSICKLHHHIQNTHDTGSYIFFCDNRVAFPRLEGACKNTQTELDDFIESDLTQFKNDEIDELDELDELADLETSTDSIEESQKSEAQVSGSENVCSRNRSKKCNDVTKTMDAYLGEGKNKTSGGIETDNVGSQKVKKKCVDVTDSVDTGTRDEKKRCSGVTEVVDNDFGKEEQICGARKNVRILSANGRTRAKRKRNLKHENDDKQERVSGISVESASTRLRVCVKDINKIKETDNKESKSKSSYVKQFKTNSDTVNQSEKVNEEANYENVDQMLNQSDHTMLSDGGHIASALRESESAEVSHNAKQFQSVTESEYPNSSKHRKIQPSKLKVKNNKKREGASKDTLIEDIEGYSCSNSATTYTSKQKLNNQMTLVHKITKKGNVEFQRSCRWCGQAYPGQSLSTHTKQCKQNIYLTCFICNIKFSSKVELSDHVINHRSTDGFKCQQCEKQFANVVSLQRHLQHHNRPKNMQCEQCGKAFYFFNLLKKHMAYCNREPDIDCPHCELKFKTQEALKHHMSVHSSERPFVCHICGYAVKKSMYLKRHIRSHTGERPYVCTECGMKFAAANGLNRHRKTHTNDKPCICQFCGKSFVTNWNLKTHLRQHTGEKPYRCEQCGKAFKQNVLLKLHKKSHHLN